MLHGLLGDDGLERTPHTLKGLQRHANGHDVRKSTYNSKVLCLMATLKHRKKYETS